MVLWLYVYIYIYVIIILLRIDEHSVMSVLVLVVVIIYHHHRAFSQHAYDRPCVRVVWSYLYTPLTLCCILDVMYVMYCDALQTNR